MSRMMSTDQIDLNCLRKAQHGCQESRSLLAQQAKGKVYTFIYRAILDRDLSEDLTQETLSGSNMVEDLRCIWRFNMLIM